MKNILALLIFILCLLTTFNFYKLYQGSIYQNLILDDFNRTQYFNRPLDQVKQIPDEYPNIGVTTMPIKTSKAIYYLTQDSLDQAKNLLYSSLKLNPYLGITETTLSEIFFKENELDSAQYYAEKALKANYRNVRHILNLQKIIFRKKEFNKADSILDMYKGKMYNAEGLGMLYQNHLALLAESKTKYSPKDSLLSEFAAKEFPDNIVIQKMKQVITNGLDVIIIVNELDKKANEFYKNKQYLKASKNWEQAISIKEDDAYYLNLFQCLIILEEYDKLERLFNEFENKSLNENDGKFEYLKGLYYQKINQVKKACEFYKISFEKGFNTSKSFIEYNKCD